MKTKLRLYGIYLVKIILLAIIYRIAAILGLSMAYVQANTSPVWPPTGIALAALMLFGIKLWPGVALGVLLGSLFTGAPIPLAIGMTFGNTLEAVIGAYLLHRFLDFHNTLDRIKDVIGLSLVSAIATMVSATFGAITLSLIDSALWQYFISIWSTWWIGDLLGALVVTPLLLTWLTRPWNKTSITRYVEGLLVFALLGVLTWFVFSNNPPTGILHLALLYVIFPLMIWISLRFGTRGAAIGLFLVSGVAIWGTIRELGPFSHQPLNDSLVLLQTFTGVVSLTSLILAAATAERLKAIFALHQKVNDLAVLNDASETFLGTFDQESIYKTICQLAVKRFGLEVAWIEITDLIEEQNRVIAIQGLKVGDVPKLKKVWQGNPAGFVSDKIEVRTVRSLENEPEEKDMQYQAFGSFPLTFGTQSMGTLKLLSNQEDYFTNDRTVLIQSFANLAAVTIQNSWLLERVRKGNEQLHALSQRLMKAQEEERLHLSRELHDESGQLLAALMVELGLLDRESSLKPDDLKKHITKLKKIVDEVQDNLHKMAVNLRPASLDHLGLVSAIQQYVSGFSKQYGIPVEFESVGMRERRFDRDIETALFRIVQESLTNVILHAQAQRVDILLNRQKERLVAIIEDDGIGFIPSSPGLEDHLGLFGMRERVEMLGGKLTLESSPGKGTTVKVEMPCHD